jgi:hypothetical protein
MGVVSLTILFTGAQLYASPQNVVPGTEALAALRTDDLRSSTGILYFTFDQPLTFSAIYFFNGQPYFQAPFAF